MNVQLPAVALEDRGARGRCRVPLLRAANGPVCIETADRKYGLLVAGGQGSGKTCVLYRAYLADIQEANTAAIIMDPKSELAPLCLQSTPPAGGKRVWYLDLGEPAFGMSPLRLHPDRTLTEQASAIAENVVQAISDTAEGQVFQSSRRYLYHAVIGALALAAKHEGLASFENVHGLLLPARAELREQAAMACKEHPDLEHTVEFFEQVLPAELDGNRSNTYQRLDPPRNKIEAILASPALKRFFNHPVDVRLSEIIEARDILLVDANMGAVGAENAQVVMHFLFRELHSRMQRQIHMPARSRPRVALICDEGSYLASRNVIQQIATHREAGLDVVMGIQYFDQLGAGAQSRSITDEIRNGVINLLQSHYLFRVGSPEDAEAATRMAMPVYQSAIGADLASRELMGVPPEKSMQLPVWHCIASQIANGARAPAYVGQTFPLPKTDNDVWATDHLRVMSETVTRREPPPANACETDQHAAGPDDRTDQAPVERRADATPREPAGRPAAEAGERPAGASHQLRLEIPAEQAPSIGRVTPLIREAERPPQIERSQVRARFAAIAQPSPPREAAQQQPESIRELAAYVDPLASPGKPERNEPAGTPPRLNDQDYAILALLDRAGLALPGMIRRAVNPTAAERTIRDRLNKLYTHGLIARRTIRLSHPTKGALPYLYSITRAGMQAAQQRTPAAIPPERTYREMEITKTGHIPHDLHVISWVSALHQQLGRIATDRWCTPRWPQGILKVPHTGQARHRHRVDLGDIQLPEHTWLYEIESSQFAEIQPDATCEIRLTEPKLTFDLLIELDLTGKTPPQQEKLRRYDALLAAWWMRLRRYEHLRTRPILIIVCQDIDTMRRYAHAADQTLKAAIGATGSPAHERYYPGREHTLLAIEQDIHHGQAVVYALPSLPPEVREAVDGNLSLTLSRMLMLPEHTMRDARARNVGN